MNKQTENVHKVSENLSQLMEPSPSEPIEDDRAVIIHQIKRNIDVTTMLRVHTTNSYSSCIVITLTTEIQMHDCICLLSTIKQIQIKAWAVFEGEWYYQTAI